MGAASIAAVLLTSFALSVCAARTAQSPIVWLIAGGTHALVLGASSGSRWVNWEKTHASILAGDRYRFVSISGSTRVATVTKPVLSEASGAAYTVTVSRAGEKSPEIGLPTSARWNLSPRPVKMLPRNDPAFRRWVAAFLTLKGLLDAEVEIGRVRQCDLDGDGAKETVIEAHSPHWREAMREGEASTFGQFSVVLVRQANGKMNKVAGEIQTQAGDNNISQIYELAHLLDLNGDGRMEIVVESTYYEGGGAEVYGWNKGRITLALTASDGL